MKLKLTNGEEKLIDNPAHFPSAQYIEKCYEPFITALIIVAVLICIYLLASSFVNKVLVPYKYKTFNLSTEELFQSLDIVVKNEIDMFEKSVFENGGKLLNNQTFDNYYKEICTRIVEDLSEEFLNKFEYYMDRKSLIRFITRLVRSYLSEKIL